MKMPQSTGDDGHLLRAYLAGRDVSCSGCGYNLRALSGDACPECSSPVSLSVQADEPFRKWRRALFWSCAALAACQAIELFRWARAFTSDDLSRAYGWYVLAHEVAALALLVWLGAACFNLQQHRRDGRLPSAVRHAMIVLVTAPFIHLALLLGRSLI